MRMLRKKLLLGILEQSSYYGPNILICDKKTIYDASLSDTAISLNTSVKKNTKNGVNLPKLKIFAIQKGDKPFAISATKIVR